MSPIHTVRMIRDAAHGGATSADVHPDEVARFAAAGFIIDATHAAPTPKKPATRKAAPRRTAPSELFVSARE